MRLVTVGLCLIALMACGSTTDSDTDTDSGTDADSDSTVAGTWYATCGDPVCQGYTGPFPDVALCTDEAVGDACDDLDATCDPEDGCNALVVCATEDPTTQPGGCPISRAAHKTDIRYLSPADRAQAATWLEHTRLATWRYRDQAASEPVHLGFLIDDQPTSPAVRPDGEHVDLYGYTSLAVAALQEQQEELERLRGEVEALRAEVQALRKGPE